MRAAVRTRLCVQSTAAARVVQRVCRPRPRVLAKAAAGHIRTEAHVGSRLADAVAPVAARAQRALLGVAALLQSLVRCLQLAAAALQLRVQQQQLAYAGPAMGEEGNQGAGAPLAPVPVLPQPPAAVMDFISAATTQLRCTLTDASQGLERKMSIIEHTAGGVQGTLYRAAQAHQEAVRSNPAGGMWQQPCIESVLHSEEQLRQAVFAQVYAELLQRDNAELSFNVSPDRQRRRQ